MTQQPTAKSNDEGAIPYHQAYFGCCNRTVSTRADIAQPKFCPFCGKSLAAPVPQSGGEALGPINWLRMSLEGLAEKMGERCGDHCPNSCWMCEARNDLRMILISAAALKRPAAAPIPDRGAGTGESIEVTALKAQIEELQRGYDYWRAAAEKLAADRGDGVALREAAKEMLKRYHLLLKGCDAELILREPAAKLNHELLAAAPQPKEAELREVEQEIVKHAMALMIIWDDEDAGHDAERDIEENLREAIKRRAALATRPAQGETK